jgi:hypothetical protein
LTEHNFADSLKVGEKYEKMLDEYFRQWFIVSEVSMDLQRLGIDRIFTKRKSGERFTVEYKADEKAETTGNMYIETVSYRPKSANSLDKVEKKGWIYTSTAQLLVYFVPGWNRAYIMDMLTLRDKVNEKWAAHHRSVTVDNGDYEGEGILVPFQKMDKHCRGRVKLGGPKSTSSPQSRGKHTEKKILGELGY